MTAMKKAYRARWALVDSGVVEDALVALDSDVISYVGCSADSGFDTTDYKTTDLGDVVIIPGLINAHTHSNFPSGISLEFDKGSMIDWVRAALTARGDRSETEQTKDIEFALERMRQTGTVALAEISNDLTSLEPIANSGMPCRYFCERLGFQPEVANTVGAEVQQAITNATEFLKSCESHQVTIHTAPHAPYSTSPALLHALTNNQILTSIHIAENSEEVELLKTGGGPWRDKLQDLGRDNPDWRAQDVSPVGYLSKLGILQENLLLVHSSHISAEDIQLIKSCGASVVLCPGSNSFIGTGFAPAKELSDSGVNLALGTDSLGSNTDLNLLAEMRELKRQSPELDYKTIWAMATTGGARALGYQYSLGALRVGTAPGLFAAQLDFKSTGELFEALIECGDQKLTPLHPAKLV